MSDKKMACHIYRNDEGETCVDVGPISTDLGTIQKMVGGYIENVRLPELPTAHAYVDEDGRMKHLYVNTAASALAGQTILGPMLILGNGKSGTEGDCPEEIYALLKTAGVG